MLGLDRLLRRRRRLVLGIWLAAFLAAIPLASRQADHLTGGGYADPSSQSSHVEQAIKRDFPGVGAATLVAVVEPARGASSADVRAAIAQVDRKATSIRGVTVSSKGRETALAGAGAEPGRTEVLPLSVSGGEGRATDVGRELRKKLGIDGRDPGRAADGRVDLHLVGQGALWAAFQQEATRTGTAAETRGLPVIALMLLVAFGSAAAAVLPLGLGFATVTITGGLIFALSRITPISVYVTNLVSLIGIGVAIDYSLFVLARYREEVRAGRTPEEARATALSTSGIAVAFSGATVVASLAALFLVNAPAVRSLAVGVIVVVAISVLAASTLLPVLISLLGRRAYEPGRVGRALEARRIRRGGPPPGTFWTRWARSIMARPVMYAVAAIAVLVTLGLPALDLALGNSGLRQLPKDHEIRQGVAAASDVVGPGALGPARVVVRFERGGVRDADNERLLTRLGTEAEADQSVTYVSPPQASPDGRAALLNAVFTTDPESNASRAAVTRLRHHLAAVSGGRADVQIGGTTASLIDFDKLMSDSMLKIIAFVLALSFVVLVVVLRSIVLPVKAVVMNVLSVLSAYGVLVVIFQWGWFPFLGFEKAPFIDTITPPLVLAIAFGLSMDYEIFLLSRIRERYAAHGDNRRAVAEGLAGSARTITSAALVMVAVAISFVSAGLPAVQRLGLAVAVAIAVDATIVRIVLVPALMELFGKWNWWLPRPLARILPAIEIEGAARPAEPAAVPAEPAVEKQPA